MRIEKFNELIQPVTEFVGKRNLDDSLAKELNTEIPANGTQFKTIEKACHAAIAAGWMCAEGGEGRRFGRVMEASDDTFGLSVDVVDLDNIVGPHHRHPNGEICMVMPIDDSACFDGHGRGWCVYPPGSDHFPTVTDGEALVLYLLPGGEIEFTGKRPQ
ncbi:MAG: hypothetical protein DHS20C01_03130 [marine bacterium B5-7]|nr:MAG: hypothetical protein DHS20C01_03130 [marine bacterium B5-7]